MTNTGIHAAKAPPDRDADADLALRLPVGDRRVSAPPLETQLTSK